MTDIAEIMTMSPVIPVLVVERVADALPIAEALVDGGLKVLEVTLRTPAALEAISEMAQVPGAVVGAGTVLTLAQLEDSMAAGASFVVSPGLTESLGRAAIERGIPFLPGVATAGDIMRGLDLGLRRFKFFPAATSGGIDALKALSGPFLGTRFCPTGGITSMSAPDWLAVESVDCVGGTWLVPRGAVDPGSIGSAARHAAAMGRADRW